MVTFFNRGKFIIYAVESENTLTNRDIERLEWLFNGRIVKRKSVMGTFVGPRSEMVTPWSTNAVEITQNMAIDGITRIERFIFARSQSGSPDHDPMLESVYYDLTPNVFTTSRQPEEIVKIKNLTAYNNQEGLALSPEEIDYLEQLSARLGRPLTDSEVFGFSQVNSEHCRHKIFNGTFVIDGEEMPQSLFQLIKQTTKANPNRVISAYKDNVAFIEGPAIMRFAPENPERADYFTTREIESVISLKAETHNFPTTVEPFNGAATGTGGEIRDRLGGGKASLPLAGTAVYITSYPRLTPNRRWERSMPKRKWLYQSPLDILIKASNGASDFGNKFGQPLITGSLLTFEHKNGRRLLGYDKVIMLAGGVGYADRRDAIKGLPEQGESVVVMGGDNYRIGMGGGAVSSVNTGLFANAIELNAVQRANPEMQKRVANVIRALAESRDNPIISIHDHGAGGHLNALSELVENTGGLIHMERLPIGDATLSAKEIIGNESQERMGLVVAKKDEERIRKIAERERAPFYSVGETTGDGRFVFEQPDGKRPIDLKMSDMFGSSPRTVMTDHTVTHSFTEPRPLKYQSIKEYVANVLSLEAVACKDWLTNKVDRSVTGKVARQQCVGPLQLPLSDCGVVALDYTGTAGIATSIGHAPQASLIDPAAGAILSIAEALTNIVGANLNGGLKAVSLSANWMWPCRNEGEDAGLYRAVKACSDFAQRLGINIPTGKDSLSMTQKYDDNMTVQAPGTVIISAAAEVKDVKKTVSPVLAKIRGKLILIDFSGNALQLGGSAFMQSMNAIGREVPTVDADYFARCFEMVQELVDEGLLLAAHDVSAGGLITTLLEMAFANDGGSIRLNSEAFSRGNLFYSLFAENPAVVVQVSDENIISIYNRLKRNNISAHIIGSTDKVGNTLSFNFRRKEYEFNIPEYRDIWYKTSYLLDCRQSGEKYAARRFHYYSKHFLFWYMPSKFSGKLSDYGINGFTHPRAGIKAAIIREKGVNGDREMAYALYLAGFDVKDVHMTDLMSGRETLDDVNMIVFCGGFSHSDVLGSAKGWASGFVWNDNARDTLKRFYDRDDTLSLGICNGCQLMIELNLINPEHKRRACMMRNNSHKFESGFVGVKIPKNNSVMFGSLSSANLGVWVAHGEGKFHLPEPIEKYNVVARYTYKSYPANPNGSLHGVAALASADGRHIAMMPHLERTIFPWQCAYWPGNRKGYEVTPWFEAFVNARKWIENVTTTNKAHHTT